MERSCISFCKGNQGASSISVAAKLQIQMWFAAQQRALATGKKTDLEGKSPIWISGSINSTPGCMEGSRLDYENKVILTKDTE